MGATESVHSFPGIRRRNLTYDKTTTNATPPRPGLNSTTTRGTQLKTPPPAPPSTPATPVAPIPAKPAGPTRPPPMGTPPYVTQTLYASTTSVQPVTPTPPSRYNFHSGNPTPWAVFALFAPASRIFSIDPALAPIRTAQSIVECCFAARVAKQDALLRICKFASAYFQFFQRSVPRSATTGPTALISITSWLLTLHTRGRSVPAAGRYALKVF